MTIESLAKVLWLFSAFPASETYLWLLLRTILTEFLSQPIKKGALRSVLTESNRRVDFSHFFFCRGHLRGPVHSLYAAFSETNYTQPKSFIILSTLILQRKKTVVNEVKNNCLQTESKSASHVFIRNISWVHRYLVFSCDLQVHSALMVGHDKNLMSSFLS